MLMIEPIDLLAERPLLAETRHSLCRIRNSPE
jgi:hypothetical protein